MGTSPRLIDTINKCSVSQLSFTFGFVDSDSSDENNKPNNDITLCVVSVITVYYYHQ